MAVIYENITVIANNAILIGQQAAPLPNETSMTRNYR